MQTCRMELQHHNIVVILIVMLLLVKGNTNSSSYPPPCEELLFPVTPFPAPFDRPIHWSIGYVSSGDFNSSTQFSMMRFAIDYVSYSDILTNVSINLYVFCEHSFFYIAT
jgi:hypothetical protein